LLFFLLKNVIAKVFFMILNKRCLYLFNLCEGTSSQKEIWHVALGVGGKQMNVLFTDFFFSSFFLFSFLPSFNTSTAITLCHFFPFLLFVVPCPL